MNQVRVQILGDSMLVVNWMNGGKNDKPKFRAEVRKTQILLDQTDVVLMSDHLDICQYIYRDWNGERCGTLFKQRRGSRPSVFILMAVSAMKKTRRSRTEYVQGGSSRLLKR